MSTVLKFIFVLFLLSSCANQRNYDSQLPNKDSTVTQNTIAVEKNSTHPVQFLDSLLPGIYRGTFPCEDCIGIQQTILFKKDKTYRQEQVEMGKTRWPKTSNGIWHVDNNHVHLTQNDDSEILFRFDNDTLFAQKINNVSIIDSSKYRLFKRLLASENKASEIKRKEGVDFMGMGNEPFWQLNIINGKTVSFKMPDWKTAVVAPMESIVENSDSLVYHLVTNKAKWSVTILPQFCDDGMSDFLYEYKVNVVYNDAVYKGCGVMLKKMNYTGFKL